MKEKLFIVFFLFILAFASNTYSQGPYYIRYVTSNSVGSHQGFHLTNFKRLVEKYSNDQIKVLLIMDGKYGSEHDNVMGTAKGDIEMCVLAVNNATIYAPIVGVMTLPYIFPHREDAIRLFKHPIMEEMNKEMIRTANFRALSWIVGGYRVLSNSKKEVKTPADLQGLRIRVPLNDIMQATYRAWGIEPIPYAWNKVFDGLKTGFFDGQDNPYSDDLNMPNSNGQFHTVQKYITNIHYIMWTGPVLINEDYYQSLPKKLQQAVNRAAKDAAKLEWQWIDKSNQKLLGFLMNKGLKYTEPADNEKEWIAKAKTVWPLFYDRIGGKAFVDRVVKVIEEN